MAATSYQEYYDHYLRVHPDGTAKQADEYANAVRRPSGFQPSPEQRKSSREEGKRIAGRARERSINNAAGAGDLTNKEIRQNAKDAAYAKEKYSQWRSRQRMDSGDPLASIGTGPGQESYKRIQRAIDNPNSLWNVANPALRDIMNRGVKVGWTDSPGGEGAYAELPIPVIGPVKIGPGTPDPRFNDEIMPVDPRQRYNTGMPRSDMPEVPVIYSGKPGMGDITGGFEDKYRQNLYGENKFGTLPTDVGELDLVKLQEAANLKTFSDVNSGGSFEVQQRTSRPFGGGAPETAFAKSPAMAFGEMDNEKSGGTIFRWA